MRHAVSGYADTESGSSKKEWCCMADETDKVTKLQHAVQDRKGAEGKRRQADEME